jgi:hypothetical protein
MEIIGGYVRYPGKLVQQKMYPEVGCEIKG